jgi:hypothetical protein
LVAADLVGIGSRHIGAGRDRRLYPALDHPDKMEDVGRGRDQHADPGRGVRRSCHSSRCSQWSDRDDQHRFVHRHGSVGCLRVDSSQSSPSDRPRPPVRPPSARSMMLRLVLHSIARLLHILRYLSVLDAHRRRRLGHSQRSATAELAISIRIGCRHVRAHVENPVVDVHAAAPVHADNRCFELDNTVEVVADVDHPADEVDVLTADNRCFAVDDPVEVAVDVDYPADVLTADNRCFGVDVEVAADVDYPADVLTDADNRADDVGPAESVDGRAGEVDYPVGAVADADTRAAGVDYPVGGVADTRAAEVDYPVGAVADADNRAAEVDDPVGGAVPDNRIAGDDRIDVLFDDDRLAAVDIVAPILRADDT